MIVRLAIQKIADPKVAPNYVFTNALNYYKVIILQLQVQVINNL